MSKASCLLGPATKIHEEYGSNYITPAPEEAQPSVDTSAAPHAPTSDTFHPNVMSLDATTIVELVVGILGLWGLPILWRRILYVSRKFTALYQSSQDHNRPVRFHDNEPKSMHALHAGLMVYTTG